MDLPPTADLESSRFEESAMKKNSTKRNTLSTAGARKSQQDGKRTAVRSHSEVRFEEVRPNYLARAAATCQQS
jgi:hypothetical protein